MFLSHLQDLFYSRHPNSQLFSEPVKGPLFWADPIEPQGCVKSKTGGKKTLRMKNKNTLILMFDFHPEALGVH